MKRRTTPVLEVTVDIPDEVVVEIQFIFKQERDEKAPELLLKTYPGDVKREDGVYRIPMSADDTALFNGRSPFYMDTRIVDAVGNVPETPIITLYMSETLFSDKEAKT